MSGELEHEAAPAAVAFGPHCGHDECGWAVCDHTGKVEFPCRHKDDGCPLCGPAKPSLTNDVECDAGEGGDCPCWEPYACRGDDDDPGGSCDHCPACCHCTPCQYGRVA